MDIMVYNKISQIDNTLSTYFSVYGSSFPYNSGASDITISTNTTWDDACGYKKVKKLSIVAGITLRINRFPFYIFADEINFGDTSSCIDASGQTPTVSTSTYSGFNGATGGIAYDTPSHYGIGGCGGGLLIILCNKVTGANGVIKANGSNGIHGSGYGDGADGFVGSGQNALCLSGQYDYLAYYIGVSPYVTQTTYTGYSSKYRNTLDAILGYHNPETGVGLGIGAGAASSSNPGLLARITPTIKDLLFLADQKCLGGGGGYGIASKSSSITGEGGGGGGGAIVLFAHTFTATPTLQANGGTGNSAGSAGVTYLMQV